MIWGLLIGLLAAGITAVLLGIRGRRVGKQPHCGWCNRALDVNGPACPELCADCGGSLLVSNGTRAGHWRRGWISIVLGASTLAAAAIALYCLVNATSTAHLRRLPLSALVLQARHTGPAARDAALNEILRRHQDAPLGPGTLRALAGPAIEAMAETAPGWDQSPWFRVLDTMFETGSVPEPDRERYVRRVLGDMEAPIPSRVLAGDPLENQRHRGLPRPKSDPVVLPSAPVVYAASIASATLDGVPLELDSEENFGGGWALPNASYKSAWTRGGRSWSSSSGTARVEFPCSWLAPFTLEPGSHTLSIRWNMYAAVARHEAVFGARTVDRETGRTTARPMVLDDRFPIRWEIETTHEITAFAAPIDMIEVITAAEGGSVDTEAIWAEFEFHAGRARSGNGPWRETLGASLSFGRNEPAGGEALPIVGRVELRSGDRSWPLYDVFPNASQPEGDQIFIDLVDGYGNVGVGLQVFPDLPRNLTRIDVVIIPDVDHAAKVGSRPGGIERIWGEEIVIPDVPLDWPSLEKAVQVVDPPDR